MLAAVADLRNLLIPEQLLEVRSILERNTWHYTLIASPEAVNWITGWLTARDEHDATEQLSFSGALGMILQAANDALNVRQYQLSPLARQILETYRAKIEDNDFDDDIYDAGQEIRDLFGENPEYLAAIQQLRKLALERHMLFIVLENVGDELRDYQL